MPDATVKLCEEADAILLGACGLPSMRYPDNTEIMPQVELRFIFDLYAGVRPCRLIPGVPSPIVGAAERGIDLVVIRESTEGPVRLDGQGRGHRGRRRARRSSSRARPRSACSTSRSAYAQRRKARGATRAGSPASTRPTRSRPTPSSASCSTSAPRSYPDVADRPALRRRLRRHAGAPAVGLRRAW